MIVAPATAHLIARMAQGLADDFLTSLLLARTAPVLVAPAMNDEMYAGPRPRPTWSGCGRVASRSSVRRSARWPRGRPSGPAE